MTATYYVSDVIHALTRLPENSVDLVLSSPPFLALRSYLPQDHPDKLLEGGSQATPGEFIDWLLDVVEACARVLAPHGSLCFELGDTYSGSGGGGGDYYAGGLREGQPGFTGSDSASREALKAANAAHWRQKNPPKDGRMRSGAKDAPQDADGGYQSDQRVRYEGHRAGIRNMNQKIQPSGPAWPLAKSLSLIPESFRFAMVYGHNPFTGRTTPRWRLRNVIRWVRPNPPVGALGDKFRPATSELMVFCKSGSRFFDLDAVREPYSERFERGIEKGERRGSLVGAPDEYAMKNFPKGMSTDHAGAPPLDWWNIPPGGYPGAHYAVWPPELCIKPIKAMCPERVCVTCGEPSRRIVRTEQATDERLALAVYLRTQRATAGVSVKELAAHFPSVSGGMTGCVWNWENAANVPTAEQWPILKGLLALDDRFDELVTGERIWTESEIEYRDVSDYPSGWTQDGNGRVYQRLESRKDRIAPDRFSDCSHNTWRPGVVLDCFAGSGTTLAVATGHGRDAIGIDLDERNYELALDRVGPLVLQRAEVPA